MIGQAGPLAPAAYLPSLTNRHAAMPKEDRVVCKFRAAIGHSCDALIAALQPCLARFRLSVPGPRITP
jgi:hypothetical protein